MGSKPQAPAAPLTRLQEFQKRAKDAASMVASSAKKQVGAAAAAANRGLQAADEKLHISESAEEAGARIAGTMRELDERHDLAKGLQGIGKKAGAAWQSSADAVTSAAERAGLTEAIDNYVLEPGKKAAETIASSDVYKGAKALSEGAYGAVRTNAKALLNPSLPSFEQDALLEATERELAYIAACVMQISVAESRSLGDQFGRAVFAKASGAAAVTGVLSLVAAFGTSGTGTAIAALHGAALSSASLAWVGGLIGGGMAAGAVLTGGVGLVVGLGAYKALASERRSFESLSELEQSIVQSCWALGTVCAEYRKQPIALALPAVVQLLEGALRPLYERISANLEALCVPLDGKNAVALRQHALPDFKVVVLARFEAYVGWLHSEEGNAWLSAAASSAQQASGPEGSPSAADGTGNGAPQRGAALNDTRAMYAIGGVFAALLSREPLDDSIESRLVLEAMRRSSTALHGASEAELGDYLRGLSDDQQRGFAVNVKGIYHEVFFAHEYNETHTDTFARLHEQTNYPGSDVQIVDAHTGEVVKEIQLKALASTEPVMAHFERYPHVDVRVTNEVASDLHDSRVDASGFDNSDLRDDVQDVGQSLHDHTVLHRAESSALAAAGICTIEEVIQMMRGQRQFPEAVRQAASKAGVAAAATAMAALLFG